MPDALEELVLSGALFEPSRTPPRSHSPISRTPSPNTDDELFGSLSSRSGSPDIPHPANGANEPPRESIGMGPGRTGVKGVIRDRDEARQRERTRREQEIREMNSRMEKTSLAAGGKTFFEEEDQRREAKKKQEEGENEDEDEARRRYRKGRWMEMQTGTRPGAFGHLREVGSSGFVQAVEKEARDVWVVIHIYHPGIDRCADLDAELSRLARRHVFTKFLRARAGALGFATGLSDRSHANNSILSQSYGDYDEDDAYNDEDEETDTDMLPTMLIYRGGELFFTWVRVDWEAGKQGIGELLQKHHIIPPTGMNGVDEDEDDDDEDFDDLI